MGTRDGGSGCKVRVHGNARWRECEYMGIGRLVEESAGGRSGQKGQNTEAPKTSAESHTTMACEALPWQECPFAWRHC